MVKSVINYLTRNEYAPSEPKRIKDVPADPEIGSIAAEFEAYEPNPKYASGLLPSTNEICSAVVPRSLPPIEPIEHRLQAIIDSMWKRAEPAKGATRGPITMGLRGSVPVAPARKEEATYHPHVAPIIGKQAFADDWKTANTLERTNAVTMRGDSRSPSWIIGRDKGFHPPNSRTDDFYIYGVVFNYFKSYMKRRYDREITMQDYVSALAGNAVTGSAKSVLASYLLWRKVTEGEAFHLGRMVSQEALKGYISTSKSFSIAHNFGTRFNAVDGWAYITLVRGGFVVPAKGAVWGTAEQEIANWGSIPAADIVGFRRIVKFSGGAGPIYVRPTFRKTEPKAFRALYDALSHKPPSLVPG